MKDININNYEAYLLDLAEGELSPADERLLMLFLDRHPDIKAEHELFELKKNTADNIYFENKSDLKKTAILTHLTNSNFDELCIARLEGNLNSKEIIEFDESLKSDEIKEKEYELYKLTQLVPDQKVIFQKKNKLKKKEAKSFTLKRTYSVVSVAASVIILLGVYLFMPKQKENSILVSELDQNNKIEETLEVVARENESIAGISSEDVNNKQNELTSEVPTQTQKLDEEIPFIPEDNIIERFTEPIAMLDPIEINYNFGHRPTERNIVDVKREKGQKIDVPADNSMSFKSYLAASFNKRILNKENKNNIELFDIAQVSLEKVNKITGSKMSLERVYDENGDMDRTTFNSRLLAFSSPIKKD